MFIATLIISLMILLEVIYFNRNELKNSGKLVDLVTIAQASYWVSSTAIGVELLTGILNSGRS